MSGWDGSKQKPHLMPSINDRTPLSGSDGHPNARSSTPQRSSTSNLNTGGAMGQRNDYTNILGVPKHLMRRSSIATTNLHSHSALTRGISPLTNSSKGSVDGARGSSVRRIRLAQRRPSGDHRDKLRRPSYAAGLSGSSLRAQSSSRTGTPPSTLMHSSAKANSGAVASESSASSISPSSRHLPPTPTVAINDITLVEGSMGMNFMENIDPSRPIKGKVKSVSDSDGNGDYESRPLSIAIPLIVACASLLSTFSSSIEKWIVSLVPSYQFLVLLSTFSLPPLQSYLSLRLLIVIFIVFIASYGFLKAVKLRNRHHAYLLFGASIIFSVIAALDSLNLYISSSSYTTSDADNDSTNIDAMIEVAILHSKYFHLIGTFGWLAISTGASFIYILSDLSGVKKKWKSIVDRYLVVNMSMNMEDIHTDAHASSTDTFIDQRDAKSMRKRKSDLIKSTSRRRRIAYVVLFTLVSLPIIFMVMSLTTANVNINMHMCQCGVCYADADGRSDHGDNDDCVSTSSSSSVLDSKSGILFSVLACCNMINQLIVSLTHSHVVPMAISLLWTIVYSRVSSLKSNKYLCFSGFVLLMTVSLADSRHNLSMLVSDIGSLIAVLVIVYGVKMDYHSQKGGEKDEREGEGDGSNSTPLASPVHSTLSSTSASASPSPSSSLSVSPAQASIQLGGGGGGGNDEMGIQSRSTPETNVNQKENELSGTRTHNQAGNLGFPGRSTSLGSAATNETNVNAKVRMNTGVGVYVGNRNTSGDGIGSESDMFYPSTSPSASVSVSEIDFVNENENSGVGSGSGVQSVGDGDGEGEGSKRAVRVRSSSKSSVDASNELTTTTDDADGNGMGRTKSRSKNKPPFDIENEGGNGSVSGSVSSVSGGVVESMLDVNGRSLSVSSSLTLTPTHSRSGSDEKEKEKEKDEKIVSLEKELAALKMRKDHIKAHSDSQADFTMKYSREVYSQVDSIMETIGLLNETELSHAQSSYVQQVQTSVERILRMSSDVRLVTLMNWGKSAPESKPFSPRALCEEVMTAVISSIEDHKGAGAGGGDKDTSSNRQPDPELEVIIDVADDIPVLVSGDEGLTKRAVETILQNAIKFTPPTGQVMLTLKQQKEKEKEDSTSVFLSFVVSDTGIGIDELHSQDIYRPFFKSSAVLSETTGSGVGLYVCSRISKFLGGSVGHTSTSSGTSFTMTLPLAKVSMARTSTLAGVNLNLPVGSISLAELKSMETARVLVVENNDDARRVIVRMLEALHCGVVSCKTVHEALDLLTSKTTIALIDYDLRSSRTGAELVKSIRKRYKRCRTVLMATLTQRSINHMRPPEWCDLILTKPVRLVPLIRGLTSLSQSMAISLDGEGGRGARSGSSAAASSRVGTGSHYNHTNDVSLPSPRARRKSKPHIDAEKEKEKEKDKSHSNPELSTAAAAKYAMVDIDMGMMEEKEKEKEKDVWTMSTSPVPSIRPFSLILVEPDPQVGLTLLPMAEGLGCVCEVFASVMEAVAATKARSDPYDLVLLGTGMDAPNEVLVWPRGAKEHARWLAYGARTFREIEKERNWPPSHVVAVLEEQDEMTQVPELLRQMIEFNGIIFRPLTKDRVSKSVADASSTAPLASLVPSSSNSAEAKEGEGEAHHVQINAKENVAARRYDRRARADTLGVDRLRSAVSVSPYRPARSRRSMSPGLSGRYSSSSTGEGEGGKDLVGSKSEGAGLISESGNKPRVPTTQSLGSIKSVGDGDGDADYTIPQPEPYPRDATPRPPMSMTIPSIPYTSALVGDKDRDRDSREGESNTNSSLSPSYGSPDAFTGAGLGNRTGSNLSPTSTKDAIGNRIVGRRRSISSARVGGIGRHYRGASGDIHRPGTVLVVEDNPVSAHIVTTVVENHGYHVMVAENGKIAYDMFIMQHIEICIVLMDVGLPVMNGLDCTNAIRKYERQHELFPTPIVALTDGGSNQESLCLEVGCTTFIAKPVDYRKLMDIVVQLAPPPSQNESGSDLMSPRGSDVITGGSGNLSGTGADTGLRNSVSNAFGSSSPSSTRHSNRVSDHTMPTPHVIGRDSFGGHGEGDGEGKGDDGESSEEEGPVIHTKHADTEVQGGGVSSSSRMGRSESDVSSEYTKSSNSNPVPRRAMRLHPISHHSSMIDGIPFAGSSTRSSALEASSPPTSQLSRLSTHSAPRPSTIASADLLLGSHSPSPSPSSDVGGKIQSQSTHLMPHAAYGKRHSHSGNGGDARGRAYTDSSSLMKTPEVPSRSDMLKLAEAVSATVTSGSADHSYKLGEGVSVGKGKGKGKGMTTSLSATATGEGGGEGKGGRKSSGQLLPNVGVRRYASVTPTRKPDI